MKRLFLFSLSVLTVFFVESSPVKGQGFEFTDLSSCLNWAKQQHDPLPASEYCYALDRCVQEHSSDLQELLECKADAREEYAIRLGNPRGIQEQSAVATEKINARYEERAGGEQKGFNIQDQGGHPKDAAAAKVW